MALGIKSIDGLVGTPISYAYATKAGPHPPPNRISDRAQAEADAGRGGLGTGTIEGDDAVTGRGKKCRDARQTKTSSSPEWPPA